MSLNKKIIGCIILFFVAYLILYIDRRFISSHCESCNNSNTKLPSIKIPLLFMMSGLIIFKLFEPYLNNCLNICSDSIVKQDIIIGMADF